MPGPTGAIHGAMTASTTNATVIARPMRKTGLRRSRRQALRISETPGSSSTVRGGERVDAVLAALAVRGAPAGRRPRASAGSSVVHAAHLVLIRGSMTAYAMSTSRLTRT